MLNLRIARGRCLPLGSSAHPEGVNFAILSRHATAVTLAVFPVEGHDPLAKIPLHPQRNRTGDHWHVLVAGLPAGFSYGWMVDGPRGPGHAFDPSIVLLDPAAVALSGGAVWGKCDDGRTRGTTRRSLYVPRPFHWQEDAPPLTPLEDSILYELHVRGFTCHPTAGVSAPPGTFLALAEKIPYLLGLGVTAVELLPIHEFDETDCTFVNPETNETLHNFWGYNSIAFAAPKSSYAASVADHGQVNEFREMVRSFHAAGIEVVLDVVFNHTGEGDYRGRTTSFRGIDNRLHYIMAPDGSYFNFTGCGNTLNCNQPVVRDQLINCLRYWVADMHIDGLRFDLASVMGRDHDGHVLLNPPVIERIGEDSVLTDTKLIAEPWDAVGLYQVGGFPYGHRWSEWNGRYRDDVRQFWRGDAGMVGQLATRLCGSADLYELSGRRPAHSINFVTCHDGFTLQDLVSYNVKHNHANGEESRDGSNENHSWNCGSEGPTADPDVCGLRRRQARNLLATLLLSQGVPMLLGGDEILRTQRGNNNAWCQDNDISWVDWTLAQKNADFLRFAREMIALRKRHPALRRRSFLRPGDVIWHGTEVYKPDFSVGSRTLALVLDGLRTDREPDRDFYMAFNAWRDPITFTVPPAPQGKPWRRVIDTAMASPLDIVPEEEGAVVPEWSRYALAPHSLLLLVGVG